MFYSYKLTPDGICFCTSATFCLCGCFAFAGLRPDLQGAVDVTWQLRVFLWYIFFPHQLQFKKKKKKSCSCPQRRQKWVFDHHRFLVRVLFLHGIPCNPSWRDYTDTTIRTSLEILTIFVSFVCFLLSGCLLWCIFTPETWSKMEACSYLINKLKGHCGNIWSWAQMKFSFLRPVYHLRKKQKMLWMRCSSKISVHVLGITGLYGH